MDLTPLTWLFLCLAAGAFFAMVAVLFLAMLPNDDCLDTEKPPPEEGG